MLASNNQDLFCNEIMIVMAWCWLVEWWSGEGMTIMNGLLAGAG